MTAKELARQKDAIYLGDGVYAFWDGYGELNLATSDGISVTNRIVLEPEVLSALTGYLANYIVPVKRHV